LFFTPTADQIITSVLHTFNEEKENEKAFTILSVINFSNHPNGKQRFCPCPLARISPFLTGSRPRNRKTGMA
jgi:hypothetical protein